MVQITDLPVEVLSNILSRDTLSGNDLFNATMTCQDFYWPGMRSLYSKFGYGFHTMTARPKEMEHKYQMTERWLSTVSKNPHAAAFVDTLCACQESMNLVVPRAHALHISPAAKNLLQQMPVLTRLHIAGWVHELDFDGLELPELQVVTMDGFNIFILDQILLQPKLWSLKLYRPGEEFISHQPLQRHRIGVSHGANLGSQLVLDSLPIAANDMQFLVERMKDLETFEFRRCVTDCEDDAESFIDGSGPGNSCARLPLDSITKMLKPARQTLEKLVLLWNGSPYCQFDKTVLGSLVQFNRLKRLKIEDTFFLGAHYVCRRHRGPGQSRPAREVWEIPGLLPSSIESLEIYVRQERIDKDYLNDLVKNLCLERKRLLKLRYVNIIEATGDCHRLCVACTPERNEERLGFSQDSQSGVTWEQIVRWQKKLASLRIGLDYIRLAGARGYKKDGHAHFAKWYQHDRMKLSPTYLHSLGQCEMPSCGVELDIARNFPTIR